MTDKVAAITLGKLSQVSIASIQVPARRRQAKGVEALAEAIRKLGTLLNPITLTEQNVLIAGLRRLEACKLLGWKKIPAYLLSGAEVDAVLAEIDENLERQPLTALEHSEHMKARKEIYLAKYPDTRPVRERGGPGRGKKETNDKMSPVSFADTAADSQGVTSRTVQRDVRIAEAIPEEVRDSLRGTAVEDKQADLLKLAGLEVEEQVAVAEKIKGGEATGVKQALNLVRSEEIAAEPAPLPAGPFRVIVIDPPWSYANRATDTTHRAASPYPSMSLEEIAALPVAERAHTDAVLWLWATNAHLPNAFAIVEGWGFEYKTLLTWAKDRMGTGDWLRGQTEHCLLCTRGQPTITLTNQTTLVHGPLREHSRKPDEFYALVEALCPGSKLELFARQQRPGWTVHGNQTKHFSPTA
jgi:N6-adenosine-specific RNA methylase IME4